MSVSSSWKEAIRSAGQGFSAIDLILRRSENLHIVVSSVSRGPSPPFQPKVDVTGFLTSLGNDKKIESSSRLDLPTKKEALELRLKKLDGQISFFQNRAATFIPRKVLKLCALFRPQASKVFLDLKLHRHSKHGRPRPSNPAGRLLVRKCSPFT